ncbi:MAG: acyl-CoA thioesterase [Nocardioides sp.]|uniref:acyl-CoA thioesterase n=1 Tax=Nocardioides sp. TaxID=35761 RepID=UPI003F056FF3
MPASAAELLELLELERLDLDLYRGRQAVTERQRVFGGQVAAQALLAGAKTVDPRYVLHSMHSVFLHPGDTAVPIIYDVERLRDSRSFATRRVSARQHGRIIFTLATNHQVPEDGLEHQDRMPSVVPPQDAVDIKDILATAQGPDGDWDRDWAALDVRYVGTSRHGLPEDLDRPSRAQMWIRIAGDLPQDTVVQQAAFAYASDLTLLGSSLVLHGRTPSSPDLQAASLDHSIWFHKPFRADRWWLYDQVSPRATGGRGFTTARVFDESGDLVASVVQEGLIRVKK